MMKTLHILYRYLINPLLVTILTLLSLSVKADTIMVKRVIDGDTFEAIDGSRIRMLGINAPEIKDLMGKESKEHLRLLIESKVVELFPDHISADKDRYKRLLRYVVLNGTDINKKMIEEGYAFAYPAYKVDRLIEYRDAEKIAKQRRVGIWSNPEIDEVIKQQDFKESDNTEIYKLISLFLIGIAAILVLVFFRGKRI
jgi:micrococcal nuclease